MPELPVIRILVADHHAVVCSGISAVLKEFSDFDVVGQAESGEEALQLIEHYKPDVVAIDIDLPGQWRGMEVIRAIRDKSPQTRILVLTNLLEEMIVHNALQAGAIGYLLKKASAKEVAHAIRAAYKGIATLSPEVTQMVVRKISTPFHNGHNLTARESQVLELLARGRSNNEIADQLGISLSTVQFHVSNILNKLGVQNRIEATAFAVRHRLAD